MSTPHTNNQVFDTHTLMDTLGLTDVPAQEQDHLMELIGETVLYNAMMRFAVDASPQTVSEIESKMTNGPMLEFFQWVMDAHPDFMHIINDEMRMYLEQLNEMVEAKEL